MNTQNPENKMFQHVTSNYNTLYEAALTSNCQQLEQCLEKLNKEISPEDLEDLISRVCMELKLNNIHLSDDTLLLLEKMLLQIRFFSNDSRNIVQCSDIENRILLINGLINDLHTIISNDEIFMASLTFIVKQIHVLKNLLKSTYDRLPWEEIEFCCLCSIRCFKTSHELNMFYASTVNKHNIVKYLKVFSARLVELNVKTCNIRVAELSKIPKLKRDDAIQRIVTENSEFLDLYNEHEHIRDIHSLSLISEYVSLVNNVNPMERNGQNVIIRALQVIGEHIKNTLQSPKLSTTTSDLLLLSLHKNTRTIVINLRDSLSHAFSMSERLKLQETEDLNFFKGIKSDIQKIGRVTERILLKNKIQLIRTLGNKFVECEDVEEMKEISLYFKNFKILDLLNSFRSRSDIYEIGQLKCLVDDLSKIVVNPSHVIKGVLEEMQQLARSEGSLKHKKDDLLINIAGSSMTTIRYNIEYFLENSNLSKANIVQLLKYQFKRALETITPKMEFQKLERIAEMAVHIRTHCFHQQNEDEIYRLVNEIIHTVKFGLDRISWAEKFQIKLKQKPKSHILECNKEESITKKVSYREQLMLKIAELDHIFKHNSDKDTLTYFQFSNNRQLQAVVEVLLLDIFSISVSLQKCQVENKILYLDEASPSLIGNNMRNYLAHNNFLIDVLFNPTLALFINAEKVNKEGSNLIKQNIGNVRKYESSHLRKQYDKINKFIFRKQKMFLALRNGDFETFSTLTTDGAEMRAKDCLMSTSLHFAAENSSVKAVEYLYNQGLNLVVKNNEFHTPLHVAAMAGNKEVVEFILKSSADCIDDKDQSGKTALHCAAHNGHELTVKTLLKYKANSDVKNVITFTPLQFAVIGGNKRVVQILLEYYNGKNLPEVAGGVTLLHLAAENGASDIVQFLLNKNVNINASTDTGITPLFLAVCCGQLKAVSVLIQNGADVNALCANGDSPLFYAAQKNFDRIVDILLQNGANVNITDLEGQYTPLHAAMTDGNVSIAKNLLHYGANINAVTVGGFTALHFAVQARHTEVVRLFLKQKDIDVNIKCYRQKYSPLQKAAQNGELEIAKLLIEKGARLHDKSDRESALYLAAENGHEAVLELLIDNAASVNVSNLNGAVPLHAAVTKGNVSIINRLIQKGADVNMRTSNQSNCLHIAARNGKYVVELLVRNGVHINSRTLQGNTPLHEACLSNHQEIVKSLIQNGADIDALDPKGYTAFHIAAAAGCKDIMQTLIEGNADFNIENETGESPLFVAVRGNQKEVVDVLLAQNVTYSPTKCMFMAILQGNAGIVESLLNHRPCTIREKTDLGNSVLHVAVEFAQIDVLELLLKKGADVNATDDLKVTPLFMAAQKGFHEIAEMLITGGANIHLPDNEGLTPLHAVSKYGNLNIAQMLIKLGARPYVLDHDKRLPIEFAAAEGHLEILKMLFTTGKIDINRKGNEDFTMLHIAAERGRMEIIEYLIQQGADINSRNNNYSKPVHIAAREGYLNVVELFVRNGIDINDRGIGGNTLLHYASSFGRVKVMKYLLDKGLQVDYVNLLGQTSLHIACQVTDKDSVKFLLDAGATFDISDVHKMKPINYSFNRPISEIFNSLNKLFDSIKLNEISEIEKLIKEGISVNVRHTDKMSPLHFAVYKNRENIIKLLLNTKASVNSITKNGWTVLHYAAKFSDIKVVKLLLSHGAKYDAPSDTGKTPLQFSRNDVVKSLLKLVAESFESITKGDKKIITLLKNEKDVETVKAVMNAQNRQCQTVMMCARQSGHSETEELKWLGQRDLMGQAQLINWYTVQEKYSQVVEILENIHKRRCDVFGENNCITLEILVNIADILCKQQNYRKAVSVCKDVYQKQLSLLGPDNEQALRTNSMLGLSLHRLGKNDEAWNIFKETNEKQKKILKEDHDDLFRTQCHMALVLNALHKFEEALEMNKSVHEISKKKFGVGDPATLNIQNNMAMVFTNMGKYAQAIQIYDEVYNVRKKILGAHHSDTLRCLCNKIGILKLQKKDDEALKAYEQIYNDQKQHLGLDHIDTMDTCQNIGDILVSQGKMYSAFKMFREVYDRKKTLLGEKHPEVIQCAEKMKIISECSRLSGMPIDINNCLENLQVRLNKASSEGDLETVQNLLQNCVRINEKDIEGRTALHFAVDGSHMEIINLLLLKGADVTKKTKKGNTVLHTACSKNSKEVVEILLNHVNKENLYDFINAQTNAEKQTALHIAAKKDNSDIAVLLLEKGAIYNIRNKSAQSPSDVTQNPSIIDLLTLIEGMFRFAEKDNVNSILSMLNMMNREDFVCVMNAHNFKGCTLLKILIGRGAIETSRILVVKLKMIRQR